MTTKSIDLPEGIKESDLALPDWKSKVKVSWNFEIWYTARFGWCIPTLLIRGVSGRMASRGITNERTYATTLDGQVIRIGLGPHVLARHTVYVKESRLAALQKYVDIQHDGQVKANDVRDRISTRRANTISRRRF